MALSVAGLSLSTRRLRMVPLAPEHFALYLGDPFRLAEVLGFDGPGEAWDADTAAAMRGLCDRALARPGDFPWFSVWLLVAVAENRPVGSLCFMGPPDASGEVEIGYGTDSARRNQGFMSEAVAAVCAWALRQPAVRAVTARTDADNPASHAVLRHGGFRCAGGDEQGLLWRRDGAFHP